MIVEPSTSKDYLVSITVRGITTQYRQESSNMFTFGLPFHFLSHVLLHPAGTNALTDSISRKR